MKLIRTTPLSCLVVMLLTAATRSLHAFQYGDGDLLLVFRKNLSSDVEFNLGPVSNFLNNPNGTTFVVTNFRLSALTANFGGNLSTVNAALMACTAADDPLRRAWLTDTDATLPRQDITGSKYNVIRQKVQGIGQAAVNYTFNTITNEFIIGSSDPASFTYIASNAGATPDQIPTLSGAAPFTIDNTLPSTLRFFELKVSTQVPKPEALQVGSFSIAANGTITFTAGSSVSGPSITQQPTNVTVFAGGAASFNVTASGAPLTYKWQFNNADIPGASASSLTFTARVPEAGDYRVIVSNPGGSITSSVARLTVNLPAAPQLGSVSKPAGAPFQFQLSGTAGAYYEIQSNTNLNNTNWTTIAFITNSGGVTTYTHGASTNVPQTFYRAIVR